MIEMLLSCNFDLKAQKELLDAELDFHKKLTTGEDTTDLKRRLGQLQVEVRLLVLCSLHAEHLTDLKPVRDKKMHNHLTDNYFV